MAQSESERIEKAASGLTDALTGFQEELQVAKKITSRTATLEGIAKINRKWIKITIVGLLLDLGLTIFGGVLYKWTHDTSQNVKATECSLNKLFLGAYNPTNRPAGTSLEAYNTQFSTIVDTNKTLHCGNVVPDALK